MAWPKQSNLVPTLIGKIEHFLDDKDGTLPNQSIKFRLQVIDQEGEEITWRPVWSGNEVPYLTQAQIDGLIALASERRAEFPSDLGIQYVGRIIHFLIDEDGTQQGKSIRYRVEEVDNQGTHIQWLPNSGLGDESPFFTSQQLVAINNFLDIQRAKAENEIL